MAGCSLIMSGDRQWRASPLELTAPPLVAYDADIWAELPATSALFSDGGDYVARNDTADYLDFAPHRRPSVLALQLRLGLLPVRRARPRHHHHSHPLALGKAIAAAALSARSSRLVDARRGRTLRTQLRDSI